MKYRLAKILEREREREITIIELEQKRVDFKIKERRLVNAL